VRRATANGVAFLERATDGPGVVEWGFALPADGDIRHFSALAQLRGATLAHGCELSWAVSLDGGRGWRPLVPKAHELVPLLRPGDSWTSPDDGSAALRLRATLPAGPAPSPRLFEEALAPAADAGGSRAESSCGLKLFFVTQAF
jgi:hypothetical protein